MSNKEYRRLMSFYNAKHAQREHQIRTSPSRRTSKHPGVGAIFKHSHIISEPLEKLYISPNNYKSVNHTTTLHQHAS